MQSSPIPSSTGPWHLVDLRLRLGAAEALLQLIQALAYTPEIADRRAREILQSYREHPERPLLAVQSGEQLVAFAGIIPPVDGTAEIGHIAVLAQCQGHGIGRWLVGELSRAFGRQGLAAETDQGAVEFYRKCGFTIQSLGMKYPKTERFWCVLKGEEGAPPRQTVRLANVNDAALLAAMNQELIRAEDSRNPMNVQQLQERLQTLMKRAWQAAILEVDGTATGYALYRVGRDHFDEEKFYVELRQFFIAAPYRRQGLGRWFVERLRHRYFPRKSRVVLEVLQANPQGRAFWSEMGFDPYATSLEWRGVDS
jgi:GNAT superfamily N-acetyltransferase